ncbi:MAG: hypothetical protein UR22_C0002G0068 [Parcubacteria group bacterium GW2011_GWC2_32_10]|nr:MAG: hypothetical protein UR22_C0002G0068 [Parcubacteria group bacterium GW2011_GWC2_32_10]
MTEKMPQEKKPETGLDKNLRKKILDFYGKLSKESESDEQKDYLLMSNELGCLADDRAIEAMKKRRGGESIAPDFAFGMSDLVGSIEERKKVLQKESEEAKKTILHKDIEDAEEILRQAYSEVFPDIDIDLNGENVTEVYSLVERHIGKKIKAGNPQDLLAKKPEELLAQIKKLISFVSIRSKDDVWKFFEKRSNKAEEEAERKKLAGFSEVILKLKLLEYYLDNRIKGQNLENLKSETADKDETDLEKERFEMLLDEADKRGRLTTYTSVSPSFGIGRHVNSGFQGFMDAKQEKPESISHELINIHKYLTNDGFLLGHQGPMQEAGVNMAISIHPLEKTEIVTEKVKLIKKSFFGGEKELFVDEKKEITRPIIARELNNIQEDIEQMYRICCFITGTITNENSYISDNGRTGNILKVNIILPETNAGFRCLKENGP